MSTIPRMGTIKEAAAAAGLAYNAVYDMCRRGDILYIKTGSKFLINLDKFADYLNGEELAPTDNIQPGPWPQ